jgi:spermidine synthase
MTLAMEQADIEELSLVQKRRHFATAFLFGAFFLSGMSGLIYQVVWVRMLTRYLGSTTSATATVLCVFMGGLAAGAYGGGRFADKIRRLLLGYVVLEIGIALTALLASFAVISLLGNFYVSFHDLFGDNPVLLIAVRVFLSMACLFLPSALMGATLPFLTAYITNQNYFFQKGLGRLYSINTFGAVLGVIITGFFLLGAVGESSSLYIAALLNLLAAVIVYRLHLGSKMEIDALPVATDVRKEPVVPAAYPPLIRYCARIAIFISGFTALAYEILWTRFLLLPLRTSIYAFSFMLGLFLVGIAFGSWLSTRSQAAGERPVAVFALLEILIGFLTLAGMLTFSFLGQKTAGFTIDFYMGVVTSMVMVLPVAVAFGWQFPVAVRCCVADSYSPGKATGWAYSANTFGAILGSILAGFFMIPIYGTAGSMVLLAILNVVIGTVLLWLSPVRERQKLFPIVSFMVVCIAVMAFKAGNPYRDVMNERVRRYLGANAQMYAFYEGVAGTTVPAGSPENPLARHLFVNGHGMTALISETKLMAYLPLELAEDPRRMLVVCFGMGTTLRSASKYPYAKIDIDAVDIIPKVYNSFGYFHNDAQHIKSLPNIHLYSDDGRNYLLVHKNLYDVITIDPAPPVHSAGTVNLYTREFLELCKSRLTASGVVCLWLPPGPLTELLMIMKTFTNVFPGASLWGGLDSPGFFLIGGHRSFGQTDKSMAQLVQRLRKIQDLGEWKDDYQSADLLKQLYLLGPEDFLKLVGDSPEVTDDHPFTEFPLWRGVLTSKVPNLNSLLIRRHLRRYSSDR